MSKKTIATAPHEWHREANNLIGGNLVGDVCGKKSYNQALRWARPPGVPDRQNGPLQHVLLVCDRIMENGGEQGREIALDAARILTVHLAGHGVPVRLALDVPVFNEVSASLASHSASLAVADAVRAGVENKPPQLVAAQCEYAMQQLLLFQQQYIQEWKNATGKGEKVRFAALPDLSGVTADRAAKAAKGGGFWRAVFRAVWKKVRGK